MRKNQGFQFSRFGPNRPFVVSPSNHERPFDKLRTNGKFLPTGNN